ncbi:MAG TPA: hypothetical protein PK530_15405 [Anaerolineales bacterium]|nr:hypothetical protein [Anaerolineales bacterium]
MDQKTWEENIVIARKHPKMYIASDHLNQLNAVGAYINFFHAVLDEGTRGAPTTIELITSGEHHFAVANGCTAPVDFPVHENLCAWIETQSRTEKDPAMSLGILGFLTGIVMFCRHALVDISTPTEHLRQAYYEGMPTTVVEYLRDEHIPVLAPYISISFILSPQVFETQTLTLDHLLASWKWWRSEHSNPKRVKSTTRFYLPRLSHARLKYKAYSDTSFIFRVEWKRVTSD